MKAKLALGLFVVTAASANHLFAGVVGDVNGDGRVGLEESIYSLRVAAGEDPPPPVICTAPDEVLSAGRCWKDRNLGATQVATSSTDALAYGDLYQWGRPGEGHQNRTSATTAVNSANDVPGHSNFITVSVTPWDWRVPSNVNFWQGLAGTNNPCPQGFRLPTEAEFETERDSWASNDGAGAFASPLKLVMAGYRSFAGNLFSVNTHGSYWTSTVSGDYCRNLEFGSTAAGITGNRQAFGMSVRCIKD